MLFLCSCQIYFAMSLERGALPPPKGRTLAAAAAGGPGPTAAMARTHLQPHGRGAAAVPKPTALKDTTCLGIPVGFKHLKPQTRLLVSKPRGAIRSPAMKGQARKAPLLPRCPCTGPAPERGAQHWICQCSSSGCSTQSHGSGRRPCAATQSRSWPNRSLTTMRQPPLLRAGGFL